MKKVLLLVIVVFLLTGCNSSNIKTISYSDLTKKLENKENFILYFEGNTDTLKNTLEKVLEKNDLQAYTIDTKKLDQDKIDKLHLEIDYEAPSIVFIIEGKDPSVISHIKEQYTTEQEIVARLNDMEFIKDNTNQE